MSQTEFSDESEMPTVQSTSWWYTLRTQLFEVSSRFCPVDFAVLVLILAFGVFHFFSVACSSDFRGDDVFYVDAARSLVDHGFYGINGQAETNQPPGMSAVFAIFCLAGASGHDVFLRILVVFGTTGLIVSYMVLRRQVPRAIAASICLLLVSSRVYFLIVSQTIYSSHPYLLTSMGALLAALELEKATRIWSRLLWGSLLTALVIASLMFVTAGVALLGAMVATICFTFFRNRKRAVHLLSIYSGVLLIGVTAQGLWMHSSRVDASAGISACEWPVAGFPRSYLSQLQVKRGNYPELGRATPRDIVERVFENAGAHANLVTRILLRRLPQLAWMSVFAAVPLLLIALGWGRRVFLTGGNLQDWYFAGFEFTYLIWPWDAEDRFLWPLAPLACLYIWYGAKALAVLAKEKPRTFGLVSFPVAVFLAVCTWLWMHGVGIGLFDSSGLEDEFSFTVWLLVAILAAWMIWSDAAWSKPFMRMCGWFAKCIRSLRISPVRTLRRFASGCVIALVLTGLLMQTEIAHSNVQITSSTNRLSADAQAALWVNQNSPATAVVMARHVPAAFHYSKRKVVWFPPASDPRMLITGVLRNQVDFVIVVRRDYNYYLPSDVDSFASVSKAYPEAFRLVYKTPDFEVFKVISKSTLMSPAAPEFRHAAGSQGMTVVSNLIWNRVIYRGSNQDR